MDSLLASYASSDDEGEDENKPTSKPPKPSSLTLSLPPPKPSPSLPPPRLSSSFPLPKSHHPTIPPAPTTLDDEEKDPSRKPINNLFSSLPPPKPSSSSPLFSSLPPPNPPKRVVQFTPPIHPSLLKSDEDDDPDAAKQRKPKKDSSSSAAPAKSLSSMLPAPKNSLCLAPATSAAAAASRRSALQADTNTPAVIPREGGSRHEQGSYADGVGAVDSGGFGPEGDVSGYGNYGSYNGDDGSLQPNYSGGADYGNYAGNWSDGSMATMASEIPDLARIAGKRGRNATPVDIVEVNQDELIKNRPREDQTKLTGIAFGPSYQPVSSGKGKPSKLHKRKHQIGSLYFDMKQKEMELAERRSRGVLTKAETQAKYGW